MEAALLIDRTETTVRFSEVDAMGIVWHGHFVKYMEDGRESFGRRFGLAYYDLYEQGLLVPIVNMNIDYKLPVKYGERIVIETTWENCAGAKIIFNYRILRESDRALFMTARTTQVFLNKNRELELTCPDFYQEWKKGNGAEIL